MAFCVIDGTSGGVSPESFGRIETPKTGRTIVVTSFEVAVYELPERSWNRADAWFRIVVPAGVCACAAAQTKSTASARAAVKIVKRFLLI
jgi:hypothetical protein